jgi:O-antigen ligase
VTGSIVPVGLALVVGLVLAVLVAVGSWRLAVVAVGVAAVPMAAQASGNPRLFVLWCLMFTLPFDLSLYFGPISDKGGGERAFRLELSDLAILALLAFQCRDLLERRWPGWRIPKLTALWVVVMGFAVATIIIGPHRTTALHELVRMTKVTALFLVVANELRSAERVMHAVAATTLAVLFQSAFALLQYLHGAPFGLDIFGEVGTATTRILALTSIEAERVFRVSAFLGHPNLLGIYLAAAIPLAIAPFLLRGATAIKAFYLSATLLGIVALILTQSRSGWASFAFAILVLFGGLLAHRGLSRRSASLAIVGLVVMVIVGMVFQDAILRRLFESKADATVGRQVFMEDAMRMIDVKPWLGWGINSYVDEIPPYMKYSRNTYGGWIPPVHNIYLLWWAETGIIGLAIHLLLWLGFAWRAWCNRVVTDERLFAANLACLAGLLAFSVDGFLSFSLRVNPISRLYFVLAGIVFAIHYWRLTRPPSHPAGQGG